MSYAEQLRSHQMEIDRLNGELRAQREKVEEVLALCKSVLERIQLITAPLAPRKPTKAKARVQ